MLSISYAPPLYLLAQETDHFANGAKAKIKLPKNAIVGSNAERKAAWDKLSETEQKERLEQFKKIVEEAKAKALKNPQPEQISDTMLTFTDKNGNRSYVNSKTQRAQPTELRDNSTIFKPASYEKLTFNEPEPNQPTNATDGDCPTGFSTLGGIISSLPTTSVLNGKVFVFVRGTDGAVYYQTTTGGGSFSGYLSLSGIITSDPASASNGTSLAVEATGTDSNRYHKITTDGVNFTAWTAGTVTTTTNSSSNLNGDIYTFVQGQSGSPSLCVNITPNGNPTPTPTPTPSPSPTPNFSDNDLDGLEDNFENNLADGFTPYYHVSGGENGGTGFATFNNSTPLTVSQLFGSVPPISYYRVKPLGTRYANGVPYGAIQLDYLTLWNKDDGLIASGWCYVSAGFFGLAFDGLGDHNLDKERSAMLVAAPLVNGGYDSNLQNYKIHGLFTAAHEDTPGFDQSLYFFPYTPINYGLTFNLSLSRSKHATYPFNPAGIPIFWDWIIFSTYEYIWQLYYLGNIDYFTYQSLLNIADSVFFDCVIEHFQEQGGTFAGTRINVGEVAHPINNSGFIQETSTNGTSGLANKLNKSIF